MTLKAVLASRNMSAYQCAKYSGVGNTTVCDLVNEKADIGRSRASAVYKIAKNSSNNNERAFGK